MQRADSASIDDLVAHLEDLALDRLQSDNKPRESSDVAHSVGGNLPRTLNDEAFAVLSSHVQCVAAVEKLSDDNYSQFRDSVVFIRQVLSQPSSPPYSDSIELKVPSLFASLVPLLLHDECGFEVELASQPMQYLATGLPLAERRNLAVELIWALNNIASGPSSATAEVANVNAVGLCAKIATTSQDVELVNIAVWLLGNVAGDGVVARDFVLGHGSAEAMATVLQTFGVDNLVLLRQVAWCMSNLVRFKPSPQRETTEIIITLAQSLLTTTADPEVIGDALWCFAYVIEGPMANEVIDYVITSGLLPGLVGSVQQQQPLVRAAAIRVLGNVVTGTDVQTEHALRAGATEVIVEGLQQRSFGRLTKEALWFLSNVAAGTAEQIRRLVDLGGFQCALDYLSPQISPNWEESREALWTVCNAVSGCCSIFPQPVLEASIDGMMRYIDAYGFKQPRPVEAIGEAVDAIHTMWCENDSGNAAIKTLEAMIVDVVERGNTADDGRMHYVTAMFERLVARWSAVES